MTHSPSNVEDAPSGDDNATREPELIEDRFGTTRPIIRADGDGLAVTTHIDAIERDVRPHATSESRILAPNDERGQPIVGVMGPMSMPMSPYRMVIYVQAADDRDGRPDGHSHASSRRDLDRPPPSSCPSRHQDDPASTNWTLRDHDSNPGDGNRGGPRGEGRLTRTNPRDAEHPGLSTGGADVMDVRLNIHDPIEDALLEVRAAWDMLMRALGW